MLWKFSHACFSHSSFLNNWECFSSVSSTTSQFIRQQGLEAQSFLLGGPPGFCCRLFPGGITQRTLRAQFNGLCLLHHLPLIYPFKISCILSTKGEPYTVLKAKIQSVHIPMQINFRHAWIDDTINGEVEKLGKTGSGTRRLYTFFPPLFAFSGLVHLRTVSYVHRILSRIMCAIQAQHFEPLLYSTVYGPKIRQFFTLYV